MPKRTDLETILIIGAGPIVIGQACEFDYSGTQACKALKEEGYRVVLVNSNPATIMTDPGFRRPHLHRADDRRGRPPRSSRPSGPTRCCRRWADRPALNLALDLAPSGVLERYGVELIGAKHPGDQEGRGPRSLQAGDGQHRPRSAAQRLRAVVRRGDAGRAARSACRSSSGRRGRSAARAPASRTRCEELERDAAMGARSCRRPTRCWSRSRSPVGRSSSSR